jgi:hypothetical protein
MADSIKQESETFINEELIGEECKNKPYINIIKVVE